MLFQLMAQLTQQRQMTAQYARLLTGTTVTEPPPTTTAAAAVEVLRAPATSATVDAVRFHHPIADGSVPLAVF